MTLRATNPITEVVTLTVGASVLVMLLAGIYTRAHPPAGVRTAIEQIDKRWGKRVPRVSPGFVITPRSA